MRVPLSWLRDFAPFDADPADLAAALDDLGLVVEEVVAVGEGLSDVVVARVVEIAPIDGADRIRRVVVGDGSGHVDVVCGASNFDVGDLVPLAPVGAVLTGGIEIGRRTMKGVTSDGMLCSGRELGLTDDAEGIMLLNDLDGARPGQLLERVLGIAKDVVFDLAVETNRPDAHSVAGVARDLAARLGLPFAIPAVATVAQANGSIPVHAGPGPEPVGDLASVAVLDPELCPRFTARVVTGVALGASPRWLARRLELAGMRPINNVVDASNYVMLELGQPTHPYDLDRLPGHGILVRRAAPAERVTTLDGVERTLGLPGAGLGDDDGDCVICDAGGAPAGIGGIMGGSSSEIGDTTARVLLEAAYFDPMAIARTSKRLGLRTEASLRFERGCDPAAIEPAAERFCELLALSVGSSIRVAPGVLDAAGGVPVPFELEVRPSRIRRLLGVALTGGEIAALLEPLGLGARSAGEGEDAPLQVTVPTSRPDIRPAPMGEADVAEEVARTFGYSRIARRMPSWPQPGRLTRHQRDRRRLREILCGLGCTEAWTSTFVTEEDQVESGFEEPFVEVTNPLVHPERFLRSSMAPGLVRAVAYNSERRNPDVRLFEVGSVFYHPNQPGLGTAESSVAPSSERLSAVFAAEGDDAWTAVAAWHAIAADLRIDDWAMADSAGLGSEARVLHRHRSGALVGPEERLAIGVVGELDPRMVGEIGLVGPDARPRRVGWLDLDLGVLLDHGRVPRRTEEARSVSRFPSSDIDLAFVVEETVPAGSVSRTLRAAGGELLESLELFDVYRGASMPDGARSLAFRLRFCAPDRTLTDEEVGELRARAVAAAEAGHGARLR